MEREELTTEEEKIMEIKGSCSSFLWERFPEDEEVPGGRGRGMREREAAMGRLGAMGWGCCGMGVLGWGDDGPWDGDAGGVGMGRRGMTDGAADGCEMRMLRDVGWGCGWLQDGVGRRAIPVPFLQM